MLKKVLLTTDFSVASEKAIQSAIDLLHNTDCEFTLLHCTEDANTSKSAFYLNKFKEELEWKDTSPLHKYCSKLINKEPKIGILEISQEEKFDIIAGGSTGIGNATHGGSVAQFMFKHLTSSYNYFVPYNVSTQKFNDSLLIIEGTINFDMKSLIRYQRFLECLQISAKIIILGRNDEQEQFIRNELFWEVNKLFPNSEIEICCEEHISSQACRFIQENPANLIGLLASERLLNSLAYRITQVPVKYHHAAILRLSTSNIKELKKEPVLTYVSA
jgi:hypothetical protein